MRSESPAGGFLERLGLRLRIVQAPMAGVQDSRLAIAVSSAGGLGSLPAAMLDAPALQRELSLLRAQLTGPFNVNFFCHLAPAADDRRLRAWRARLAPYYDELHLDVGRDASAAAPAGSRRPFDAAAADVLEPFRPPVVSFHFGLPSAALVDRVHHWGSIILSSATTVDEARWLADRGADAIIVQGLEAGGHRGHFLADDLRGQQSTPALLDAVLAAVRLPIIAAGGLATAEQVAGVLAQGAVAAQVGTAYLLCPESTTSAVHRAALRRRPAGETAITNVFSGRPARGLVNRLLREVGPMCAEAPAFPLAAAAVAPLRAAAEAAGRDDFSPLWAGECLPRFDGIPAAVVTQRLAGVDAPDA